MNHRGKGLSIKICVKNIATYDNCGPGIHGKIDQIIPIIHKINHIIQQIMSIYFVIINCY